jgi:hypothetical protein
MNCIKMLSDENFPLMKSSEGFKKEKNNFDEFIEHWKNSAEKL